MNRALGGATFRRGLMRGMGVLALAVSLFGCAGSGSYVVLVPSPDGSVGKVIVRGDKGEQLLDRSGQAADLDGRTVRASVDPQRLDRDFGEAIAAKPPLPLHRLLYFSTGTTLTAESETLLQAIVQEVNLRRSAEVSIIGHTDTLYTTEYNEKLALKRAARVAELLKGLGLRANSIEVDSHGKRNLLIQTPDNTYEPRNRRVEVSIR